MARSALRTTSLLLTLGLSAALLTPALPAAAASNAGSDTRPVPTRIFADDSFWYRKLPANTPVASNSKAIMRQVVDTAEKHWGKPGKPSVAINTYEYTPTMYTARSSDPKYTFKFENCQNKPASWGDSGLVAKHLTGINVPADAVASAGSDQEMVIYNEDTDTVTEIWQAKRTRDGGWSACWGGSIRSASKSNGVFERPFGVSASGLPLTGGVIRAEELAKGQINHVVGIAMPYAATGTVSAPATRTDGRNPKNLPVLAQGQMIRIPAHVNIDALGLSPTARTIAKAGQEYGFIVWDTAGAVSVRAENQAGLARDPYGRLLKGGHSYLEMANFPIHLFEVLPMNYSAPASGAQQTAPQSNAEGRGATVYQRADWAGGSVQELKFPAARPGDKIIAGDWDGDGVDTLGLRRGATIMAWDGESTGAPDYSFAYGRPGDDILVGDWDGDGADSVAVVRGANYLLRNSMSGGNADTKLVRGAPGDAAGAGDFTGAGHDQVTARAKGTNLQRIYGARGGAAPTQQFAYGSARDVPLVGDWDGDGVDTIAVQRQNIYMLRNDLNSGSAQVMTSFGRATDQTVVGDWDGDGVDTIAVVRF